MDNQQIEIISDKQINRVRDRILDVLNEEQVPIPIAVYVLELVKNGVVNSVYDEEGE
jgi:hypothetical protein